MSRFKAADAEENVACNLIPMIDIMFLLLLFFMLSADMTQRVAEDMKLPVADKVKEEVKEKEDYPTTVVNLVHEGEAWVVKIAGTAYPDWDALRAYLTELSKDPKEPPGPNGGDFSARAIMLRAEADAPYKEVQRTIQLCGQVGLYKIEVVATRTPTTP